MKDELKKLFEGADGFKPEFLTKITGLVEAKVDAAKITAIQETESRCEAERLALVETHNTETAALKESFVAGLVEQLDGFLNAAVLEWANTNAPAIDSKLKVEMAEKFLTGMTGLFAESQIVVAGDSEGVVAGLQEKLQTESARADAATTELLTFKESQNGIIRESIINKVCEGLADTQVATVKALAEGIQLGEGDTFELRIKRFRDLVEGKPPVNKDDDKDGKDGKDDGKDKKDKPKDKDETGKEMTESIAAQIAATMALRG